MAIKEAPTDYTVSGSSTQSEGHSKSFLSLVTVLATALSPGECLNMQHALPPTYYTHESASSSNQSEVSPFAETIKSIKNDWHFNMTELAVIFGVTRPTLYSWVKGKTKPDPASLRHLQVITAAGRTWAEQTHGKNWDYILDYTGPEASDITLRERMKASDITVDELKLLIPQRIAQYQKAREEVKKIIGDPKISSGMPIRESTRKLNKRWTDHTQKLHRLRNASHE